jgi:glycosyltransferase involved in cell wall biosynthesis
MKISRDKEPLLSVLIMSYKRKEFIMEAIESVLNQTIPQSDYEIICVVGFHDDNLSRFLQINNINEIFCEGTIGQTIASGLVACRSNIVVFLDDDDKFRNDKLQRVIQAFKIYNCVYYHNNTELINKYSSLISNSISPYNVQTTKSFLWKPIHRYRKVLRMRGDFNMSSIAIRKSNLNFNLLYNIETSPDSIIFFLLMQTKLPFYFDSEKTTFYRIHADSQTNFNIKESFSDEVLDTSMKFYRSRLSAYKKMELSSVQKIFLGYVLESKMGGYINGQEILKPDTREKFKFLLIAMSRPSKFYMKLLLATVLVGVFPVYVKRIREKEIKNTKQIK